MTRIVFFCSDNHRSAHVGLRVQRGLAPFIGPTDFRFIHESRYSEPCSDIAIFYGLTGNLLRIMEEYKRAGLTAVLIDLGYWKRRDLLAEQDGYYRVSINDLHPWRYVMGWGRSGSRFLRLGIRLASLESKNGHILLAGMSEKAAGVYGLRAEEWERSAIDKIRRITRRRIIYRPKPSWNGAKPIEGVDFSPRFQPLEAVLGRAWAIVTHHSNVAIDGHILGIPAICVDGAARAISGGDLERINAPVRPAYQERESFLFNLAYAQWHTSEFAAGDWWRFYKDIGLIP